MELPARDATRDSPMDDRFQTDAFDKRTPDVSVRFPPLPPWLANRLLHADERIAWVYGPWFNPSWERYVTHPALFLVALGVSVACVGGTWLLSGSWAEEIMLAAAAGAGIVLVSIFVLGIASGYFTRLVVTNRRIIILQGHEVCRSWGLNELPYSLIRYSRLEDDVGLPTVDLDALKGMFGGASDWVADSKSILALGKQLDHIKRRDHDGR
jgi:hypothetical protein